MVKIKVFLLCLTLALFTGSTFDHQRSESMVLEYLYRGPKPKNENPPLIILLHGISKNERFFSNLIYGLPDKYMIVSARGYFPMGPDSYCWVNPGNTYELTVEQQVKESSRVILQFLDQLKTKYKFDTTQVYICGFGQGGSIAYDVAFTAPEKIKGLAILNGILFSPTITKIVPAERFLDFNIFIAAGTEDTQIPISYNRQIKDSLLAYGFNPVYKEYYESHKINDSEEADLIEWFKNPY